MSYLKKFSILTALLIASMVVLACGNAPEPVAPPIVEEEATEEIVEEEPVEEEAVAEEVMEAEAMMDIVDTAVDAGNFTTLATALEAAELIDTLKGEGPFTVFAPTDEAFAALPEGTLEGLLEDIPALTDVLLYHVVSGKVMAEDVVTLDSATTVQGGDVTITVDGETVMINDSTVTTVDINTSNGVIHVIDAVLLPPTEEMAGEEAVAEEDARIQEGMMDIVDTAIAAGNFTTLATTLEAAELIDTLKGEGPFTVFAPTDEAFAALPEGTLEGLLEDIPALTDVLLYHVVSGKVMAEDVVTLDNATTVQGGDVTITVDGETVMINDSTVTTVDINTSNGVIHVIDAVLLPPAEEMAEEEAMAEEAMMDIVDTAVDAGNFTTLATALEAAELIDTLKGEGPFTVFAPTDEAFAALPEGTLEGLLEDIPALTDVLLYHVVAGKVMAEDVVTLDSATTVQGGDVTITVNGETVMINDSTVTTVDIKTSNGVIHVIDAVLLPSDK